MMLVIYIIILLSTNSSNAEVMMTAVRTYLAMSIRKSATFSQILPLLTISLVMANLLLYSMTAKIICN